VLDLRMSCLQERLGGLRALTNVFSDANGDVVENAVNATNALSSLDRCADVPLLRAVIRPPEDPATRAKVTDLRHRLGDLKARFDAGRWKEVLQDAPALVAEARAVGYQPVIAECLALLGLTYSKASDVAAAERSMVEAFWVADSSRHDEVRAEVATNLVFVVGQEGHFEEAQRWAQAAESVLQRLGGHVLLHAWLLNNVGCTYNVHGDQQAAARTLKESLVLKEKELGPDHPDVGISEANLGISLQGMGKNQEALTHIDRSIVLLGRGLGSGHPELAAQISNRGEVLNALGRYREARQSFEQAQLIWEREFGQDNSNLGYPLTGIGLSYLDEGKPTNAILPLERARSIRAAQETAPALRADTSFALARALWEARGAHSRSRILAEEARADYSKASARSELALVQDWLHRHP
jgi:eukaryotic-like serine/threonine-protein kinase